MAVDQREWDRGTFWGWVRDLGAGGDLGWALSPSSASLHDLALITLVACGVLALFPGPRLSSEKMGGVCAEGGLLSSRSLGDLGPPGALFHLLSASALLPRP